jgi:hypothetical protein
MILKIDSRRIKMKKAILSTGLILTLGLVIILGWMCGGGGGGNGGGGGGGSKFCSADSDCDSGKACLDGYCVLVPSDNVQYAPGDYDDSCVWTASATPAPSDYACLGNNADPALGADLPVVGRVQDFNGGSSVPIGSAKLYIYSTSDVSQAPVCTITSDSSDCGTSCGNPPNCGKVNESLTCKLPENSRFTYKVTVSEQPATAGGTEKFSATCGATYTGKDTYQFNILNTDNNSGSHKEEFLVIAKGIFTIMPSVGQVTQQPGQGIIGGAVWDCNGKGVKLSVITVVNAADGSPVEAFVQEKDPAVIRYFRCKTGFGVVPAVEGTDTDSDGIFSIFNVPPGDYLIKAYGKKDGTLTLLGKARVKVFGDAISIANVEPCQDASCTPFGQ